MTYLIVFYLVTGAIVSVAHAHGKGYSTAQRLIGFVLLTPLWLPCLIARKVI